MLMLACEAQFADAAPPPQLAHWGGVLHGFVERAAVNHAAHLLPLLRPAGMDALSCMAIEPPPFDTTLTDALRFGVVLYGDAAPAWATLLGAMLSQTAAGLNGRAWRLRHAWLVQAGADPQAVLQEGEWCSPAPQPLTPAQWLALACDPVGVSAPLATLNADRPSTAAPTPPALHYLHLRTPLLLGGRGGIRRERAVPWPSLGAILDAIARRAWALQPDLAQTLGLPPDWQAPPTLMQTLPLCLADQPARQVQWLYDARRHIVKPGIVGTLIYAAAPDPLALRLLHWGQWLGVGQQTTLGCGRYVWRAQGI